MFNKNLRYYQIFHLKKITKKEIVRPTDILPFFEKPKCMLTFTPVCVIKWFLVNIVSF